MPRLAAWGGFASDLQHPVPFAAADVIQHTEKGIEFHYAIIEVLPCLIWHA